MFACFKGVFFSEVLTFEEVDAPQSSLLSAEVISVLAHVLKAWLQSLSRAPTARRRHSEEESDVSFMFRGVM